MPSARCSMLDRAKAEMSNANPADPAAATRPVAFRGAGFAPQAGRHAGWIALVLVIGIWQLAVSGALWHHLSVSIMRIGTGWILGTIAGVTVGFAIGLSSLARGIGITFISALFPIPKIALLPLLILWLGIGAVSYTH